MTFTSQVILDSLSLCCSGAVLPSLESAKDHREEEEAKDDDTVLRGDVIKVGPPPNVEQKYGRQLCLHLCQACVYAVCRVFFK